MNIIEKLTIYLPNLIHKINIEIQIGLDLALAGATDAVTVVDKEEIIFPTCEDS